MNAYTHHRALAAAARLALATVALQACDKDRGEPQPPAPSPEPPTASPATQYANAETPEPAPADGDATAPVDPVRACNGLVEEAFPNPSQYPGEKRNVGTAVKACCADLLVHQTGPSDAHRWDCCANLPDDLPEAERQKATMACTPWGPPVPPAMRPRTEVA
jgi:hypothetical protein